MSAHIIASEECGSEGFFFAGVQHRPGAVLDTLGNTLEFVIAGRVIYLTEEHRLLPGILVGHGAAGPQSRVLELLTLQVQIVEAKIETMLLLCGAWRRKTSSILCRTDISIHDLTICRKGKSRRE